MTSGRDDGWSTAKLDAPRWFTYWSADDLCLALADAGWRVEVVQAHQRAEQWVVVRALAA